jgi:flagellar hook assembly protein FlgD
VRTAVVRLESARPNPFNPATSLPLVLEEASRVELTIYNIAGRHVRTLHDGMLSAGRNVLVWDGRDDSGSVVPSGVYYARARGGWGATESQRMTLLK